MVVGAEEVAGLALDLVERLAVDVGAEEVVGLVGAEEEVGVALDLVGRLVVDVGAEGVVGLYGAEVVVGVALDLVGDADGDGRDGGLGAASSPRSHWLSGRS